MNVEGYYPVTQSPAAKAEQIVNTFDVRPDVVFLEEVCANQLTSLVDAFKNRWGDTDGDGVADLTFNYHFEQFEGRCREGDNIPEGEIVASWHPLSDVKVTPLNAMTFNSGRTYTIPLRPLDYGRQLAYHLTCANVEIPGARSDALRACATHLRIHFSDDDSGYNSDRYNQTLKIGEVTQTYINAGQRVILAGDFNSAPDRYVMDPIYDIDGSGTTQRTGWFIEMDQFDKTHFGQTPDEMPDGDSHHPVYCTSSYQCRSGYPTCLQFKDKDGNLLDTPYAYPKIDYTFFSSSGATDPGGYARTLWDPPGWSDPMHSPGSDHLALISKVTYQLPAG